MQLSKDQKKALTTLEDWFKSKGRDQFITLGGYAGTGKTTLISILRNHLNEENKNIKVAFCAYTGKATQVLKTKIALNIGENDYSRLHYPKDTIGTIHSLIYSPMTNDREEIIGWERKKEIDTDLIIVDEASMVDSDIWRDLLSYRIPIIAVGDHGQLPPIKGNFNLMQEPQIKLEEIHRQAKENPIIELSIMARESGTIPVGDYGYNVKKMQKGDLDSREIIGELLQNYKPETLVLCGYNHTRIKLNGFIRSALEFESLEPEPRDRVICLRNNHKKQIFNGMVGTIKSIYREKDKEDKPSQFYKATIMMDGFESVSSPMSRGGAEGGGVLSVQIYAPQFNSREGIKFTEERSKLGDSDLFDFGYALTVHKAQGSQSKRVILFEERFAKMDDEMWRRWLYTGVTRAEEELFIVGQ